MIYQAVLLYAEVTEKLASEQKNKRGDRAGGSRLKQIISETGMASTVEIKGVGTVLVSGCRGITDFSPERICFRTDDGMFSVEGMNLTMCGFENECIEIRGRVCAVTICNKSVSPQDGGC